MSNEKPPQDPADAPAMERMMPAAAASRSAEAVTMVGFLPPISVMTGRGKSAWKARMTAIPPS